MIRPSQTVLYNAQCSFEVAEWEGEGQPKPALLVIAEVVRLSCAHQNSRVCQPSSQARFSVPGLRTGSYASKYV